MTTKELIKYLECVDDSLGLTILPTSEYNRLRKVEQIAKSLFEEKRARILRKAFDDTPRV